MTSEDAKDLALSLLTVFALLFAADDLWLHSRHAALAERVDAQAERIAALEAKVEAHVNPPPEPTLKEKAKAAYACMKQTWKEKFADPPAAAKVAVAVATNAPAASAQDAVQTK